MYFFNRLVIVFVFQLLIANIYAADKKPKIEKQPDWITVTKVDYNRTALDNEAEDGYSDLNYEQQVSLEHNAIFYKKTLHILTEAGVQNQSQVSVDYDPTYQELSFHSIKIIRGNEIIDQLNLSKIKTIQQEKELSRFLYDGTLTAFLFLEDVRKNDIIEYSYTIKGFNPIFNNKYSDTYTTQFVVPVYKIFYKLVVPKTRNVSIKNSLTSIKPSTYSSQTANNYEWSMEDVKAIHLDDNIPSWYDCLPSVMISEFSTWSEVNDWAMKLFPFNILQAGNLQKKVDDIKQKYKLDEDRVLAALHFVQDDVRYTGIEMGENSHKPHLPSQIFNQRFGDCKDKAYLLCTLLKALGIEAFPVLINTGYKKTLKEWLPSPTAFDHTTVCANLNNKVYWFDATISNQRGRLENISYPDYQVGLVIRPGTTALTSIPLQEKGNVVSKETFYIDDLNGSARLVVTTTSSGSFADDIRYSFKNNSVKEIQKNYKSLYTSYFKKIESDSLTYTEDQETGSFTTKEYYTINDFWKTENGKRKVLIEPYFIYGVMKKPEQEKRNMPFALTYPSNYREEIEIHLPENWPIEETKHDFSTSAFTLNYEYLQPENNVVLLRYKYENKVDHVDPEETSEYLSQISTAEKTIAFELYDEPDTHYSNSSTPVNTYSNKGFTIAYIILTILALGTYFYKRRQRYNNHW